jgi:hypothetical protein
MTEVLMQHLPKPPSTFKIGQNDRTFRSDRLGLEEPFKAGRQRPVLIDGGQDRGREQGRIAGRDPGPGGSGGSGIDRVGTTSNGPAGPAPGRGVSSGETGRAVNQKPSGRRSW